MALLAGRHRTSELRQVPAGTGIYTGHISLSDGRHREPSPVFAAGYIGGAGCTWRWRRPTSDGGGGVPANPRGGGGSGGDGSHSPGDWTR